jgi:hypothetical protein
VRLTLRTLLAYLDDTLEPAETKLIGQKVAESDAAQELIARIKQVTRRRRLTTPPATGPNAFEPNTVAEYLDNTLPADQVAEIEKACLESDVHLAEIAAAHQILTLVVGQPALVPPTARQRMYALVHGRKSVRVRSLTAATPTPNGAASPEADSRAEEDETLLLGLPLYRRQGALRWLLPLAGVVLVAVLAFTIWHALPSTNQGTQVAVHDTRPSLVPQETKKEQPDGQGTKPGNDTNEPGFFNVLFAAALAEAPRQGDGPGPIGQKPPGNGRPIVRPEAPNPERREIGQSEPAAPTVPSVLVTHASASDPWQRLKPESRVFSHDMLVSLPGYKSGVRLDSGVGLTLWGSAYEFGSAFLESAVVLHVPSKDFDADFTLDRGAVMLTSHKDKPAAVRIRFHREIWDVTLEEPQTKVGVALLGRHVLPYDAHEPPRADCILIVRSGRASVRVSPYVEYGNIEPVKEGKTTVPQLISWDSVGKGVRPPVPFPRDLRPGEQMVLGVFDPPKVPSTLPREVQEEWQKLPEALVGMSARLSRPGKIETMLMEMLQSEDASVRPLQALLAVRCLGALDAIPALVDDILNNEQKSFALRREAIYTLRHWTGRNASQENLLFDPDPKVRSGLLTAGGKFSPSEAEILISLLHTPSTEQLVSPDYWAYLIDNLKHDKLAVRQVACFHLMLLPEGQSVRYDPAGPLEARQAGIAAWKKLIPDGKIPMSLQQQQR